MGADRRARSRRVGSLGESSAPAAGAQVLMSKTLDLTCDLMSRASVSPTDGGCQALMCERLKALGFTIEQSTLRERRKLLGTRGASAPVFCFAGHTDVVPPGPLEEWTDGSLPAVGSRRHALRPRRGGHEERPCRHGDRLRGIRRTAPRPPRQHRVLDHQRRGGAFRGRHAAGGRGAEEAAASPSIGV
jgi:hypothetical protein